MHGFELVAINSGTIHIPNKYLTEGVGMKFLIIKGDMLKEAPLKLLNEVRDVRVYELTYAFESVILLMGLKNYKRQKVCEGYYIKDGIMENIAGAISFIPDEYLTEEELEVKRKSTPFPNI